METQCALSLRVGVSSQPDSKRLTHWNSMEFLKKKREAKITEPFHAQGQQLPFLNVLYCTLNLGQNVLTQHIVGINYLEPPPLKS